jgi:selenocysteine lyase/cysteine desulfurase
MLALALPIPPSDAAALHQALFEGHGVEVPVHGFGEDTLLRVSLQPYNCEADLARLERALTHLLAG